MEKHQYLSNVKNISPLENTTTKYLSEFLQSKEIENQESMPKMISTNPRGQPPLLTDSIRLQQQQLTSNQQYENNKYLSYISQPSSSSSTSYEYNNINTFNEYQKYRDMVNDMTTDLVDLINQVQNQFDDNDINMINSDNIIEFEKHFNELENQNDLLQDTIKMLQLNNTKNEMKFNRILEYKEEQYKSKIKSLEQEIEQSNSKYSTLHRKYQAILYDVKQYKEKCKCGAIKAVELDASDKDMALPSSARKGPDLAHIFEMMERKDDELNVLKEFSANEKVRLNKRITDAEEQIREYEIQIAQLKNKMEKRDSELKELRRTFAEKNDDTQLTDEIDKLTMELSEEKSQRKERETTLEAKIKGLETALDETRSSLAKANNSLSTLEAQTANYRKQSDSAIMENDTLRQENLILKTEIATLQGTETSLKKQLNKTQDEVQDLRTANVKIKTLSEDVDNFKQNCVRLKHTNFELIAKYNSLIEDYNILAEEFRKLFELKEIIEKELDVFRKWQEKQVHQDCAIKDHIQQLNEHIDTLSGDQDELIQKIHDYHKDLLIVSSELDHYKEIFADTMGEAHDRASLAAGDMPGQDSADAIIRKILRTAEKLSHTRRTFEESLDRRNSK